MNSETILLKYNETNAIEKHLYCVHQQFMNQPGGSFGCMINYHDLRTLYTYEKSYYLAGCFGHFPRKKIANNYINLTIIVEII